MRPEAADARWTLRCDGAARGNPGPAGIGVTLEDAAGNVVEEVARGIGWATNNQAEYEALLEGLRLAGKHGVVRLRVYSDSKLLVEQMRGAYKVKHPGLRPLHARAAELAAGLGDVEFVAVPRESNRRADLLANEGIERDNPQAAPPPGTGGASLF